MIYVESRIRRPNEQIRTLLNGELTKIGSLCNLFEVTRFFSLRYKKKI